MDVSDVEARLSAILSSVTEDGRVVGIALAVDAGAAPVAVWSPRAGPVEPAFLAYSITKTFTAALLLLFIEEGWLTLDDRLQRWFPHVPDADRITLRQLLNHTAGIPDYGRLRAYYDAVRTAPGQPWSFERFLAETADKGLLFAPGTGWAYSNPGYMFLKRIVEEVGEQSFATLIAERIARPLGLRRTFVPETPADLSLLTPGPSRAIAVGQTPRDVRHHYHPGWVSHGVVAATPSEIVRFLAALFGRRLLSDASLQEMMTLVPVPVPATQEVPVRWVQPGYGLGLMGDPALPWGAMWGHSGGGPGYSASAFHAPEIGRVTVCAMAAGEESPTAEEILFVALDALREGYLRP